MAQLMYTSQAKSILLVQWLACHKANVHNKAVTPKSTHGFSPQKSQPVEGQLIDVAAYCPAAAARIHLQIKTPAGLSPYCVTHMYPSGQAQVFATVTVTLLALFAGDNGQNNEVLHVSSARSASKEMTHSTCSCTAGQQQLCIAAWLQHSSDIVLITLV